METITVNLHNENRPIVDSVNEYANSLLKNQYDLSFSVIESILEAQHHTSSDNSEKDENVEYSNNIVVFDGDRGAGKTSCMLSVANLLNSGELALTKDKPRLSETKWLKLPMLDPAFFDSERNVLSLIVSRLYKTFIKNNDSTDTDGKRKLLKKFVDVQKELKCLLEDKRDQDALEYLVSLSDTVDLKHDLRELINDYLDYMDKGAKKLLILIDDIDLNQERSHSMVEQIHKYLVLDNCVVLLSVKIDQLSDILFQDYLNDYKESDENIKTVVRERVDRYLTKIFPQRHRIHMPEPKDYLHHILKIDGEANTDYRTADDTTVEHAILDLIYTKTGYLFYNTNKVTSYVVPRNLRNIRQLLKLLIELHNYDGSAASSYNQDIFKHFFFNDWVKQNIDYSHEDFIRKITKVTDNISFNYIVFEYLNKRFLSNQASSKDVPQNIYNFSLGYVISIIHKVENYYFDEPTKKLLFFIKSLYSIKLNDAFAARKCNFSTLSKKESIRLSTNGKESGLVSDDYQALIAGSVLEANDLPFAEFNPDRIVDLLKKIESADNDTKIKLQRLMEFVMLITSRSSSPNEKMNSDFRQSNVLFYKTLEVADNMTFIGSVGSLLYNLSYYKEAISRFTKFAALNDFDISVFEGANSLYNSMTSNKDNMEEDFLTMCSFRNVEVLEDFYESIREKKDTTMETFSSRMLSFLKRMSKYYINTYNSSKNEDKDVFEKISFKYADVIIDLLEDNNVRVELDLLTKPSKAEENNLFKDDARDSSTERTKDMPETAVS